MTKLPSSLQRLINELSRLPGIGPKTAQRLAFYLLKQDVIDITNISEAIAKVKEGIGPESLQIESLINRIKNSESRIQEVVIATNPSLEGETTAMHLQKLIKSVHPEIKITRIARGLPMGGDLEYADDITLIRALEGRREY